MLVLVTTAAAMPGAPAAFHGGLVLAPLALDDSQQSFRERQEFDPQRGEWVDRKAQPEVGPEGAIETARWLLARGEPGAARKLLADWVKTNRDDDRYLEGLFLLAEANFQKKDFWRAYNQLEVVAENSSGELFRKALLREMDVARAFLSGEKRIVWRFLRLPAYDDGVTILDRVWSRSPGTRIGEDALRLKADYFYARGDMELAQEEYASLARQFPSSRFARPAMLRAAEAAQAAFPGVKFDERALVQADERYRQVKGAYPQFAERERIDERLLAIREKRAEKDLDVGDWYRKTGQRGAAEFYFRAVLSDWPSTLAAGIAQSRLRAMGIETEATAP
ncbi:Outer membrane protein assembly factor BamD [Phycisphaerae bacterium RAS1]|nr:Outer membrane protein assembly factor BamD [Phycisphaerae bacterium RAS1]